MAVLKVVMKGKKWVALTVVMSVDVLGQILAVRSAVLSVAVKVTAKVVQEVGLSVV